MFTITQPTSRLCDGSLTRREWLQIGGCGLLGLSLPKILAQQAKANTAPAKATMPKSNPWYPDHAVFNATKDELKAMPEFKYST